MIWVSSQLIIGYYFERYRPIASGFSCSGAGAGIFIFSITNSLLVCRIGWRNTVRVQVVLLLFILFIAMAYLEVRPTPVAVVHPNHVTDTSSNEYYGNFYVHYFLDDEPESSRRSHPALETYNPTQRRQGRLRRWATCCSPCCCKSQQQVDRRSQSEQERNFVLRADPMQHEDLFYTGPADYEQPHHKEQFDGKEFELVGSDAQVSGLSCKCSIDLYDLCPKRSTNPKRMRFDLPSIKSTFSLTILRSRKIASDKDRWVKYEYVLMSFCADPTCRLQTAQYPRLRQQQRCHGNTGWHGQHAE